MQKWEYCQLVARVPSGVHMVIPFQWQLEYQTSSERIVQIITQSYVISGPMPKEVADNLSKTIANLGNEGWEMLARSEYNYQFKRPLNSPE